MSDSFRRYTGDDTDLASTSREDARRWRAFAKRSAESGDARKRASSRETLNATARARDNVDVDAFDARELYARITAQ